jgi:hypothetical protein
MPIIKKVKSQIIEISLGANNPQGKKENQNWMLHMSHLFVYANMIDMNYFIYHSVTILIFALLLSCWFRSSLQTTGCQVLLATVRLSKLITMNPWFSRFLVSSKPTPQNIPTESTSSTENYVIYMHMLLESS